MGRSRADPMLARSCLELPRIGLIHRCNRVPMFEKRVESGGESIHRSELAREKRTGAAFIQDARVIVDLLREQARSYK